MNEQRAGSDARSENRELRATLRRFLSEHATMPELWHDIESPLGFDEQIWRRFAGQLGLAGLIVPEALGGAGATFAEHCLVLEELGSTLTGLPYLSSAIAQYALLESAPSPSAASWLPRLAAGEARGTIAVAEDDGLWTAAGVHLRATPDGGQWVLAGTKSFVLDAAGADLIVAAARTAAGLSLFVVDARDSGLAQERLPAMDPTRRLWRLNFAGVPAQLIGDDGDGARVLARVSHLAAISLAAEQVGGAGRCLQMAVDYARSRAQFGRLIGSFQAVQHMCTDMLIDLECARSAVLCGVRAASAGPEQLQANACLAKSYAADAFVRIAERNIQVHGAIGFTWEHPAHLYYKRAKSGQLMFGDSTFHRRLLAETVGLSRLGGASPNAVCTI
jgi:alkylation response protein AidB-like acyl-CoA dehydrogenase